MKVFKLYFKVFKKSVMIPALMYIVIFSALVIMFSSFGSGGATAGKFEPSKCDVAVINQDGSAFSKVLEEYIESQSKPVNLSGDEQSIKDALFFRSADYILIIPEGYGDLFLEGKNPNLETYTIPDSTDGVFVDMLVNRYVKSFDLYRIGTQDMDIDAIDEAVRSDLAFSTPVHTPEQTEVKDDITSVNFYFNYTAYPYLAMIILVVSMITLILNGKEIKRRNLCAPINQTAFSLKLFLANTVVVLIFWVIFSGYAFLFYGERIIGMQGFLYCANGLVYVLMCLALSFMISNIVSSKNAISAISNTLGLGCSFLGGVFVPQSMLSDTVKNIAIVNPLFWFVKANNHIASLSTYDMEAMKPLYMYILIEVLFAAVFMAIALVAIKQKRTAE